MIPKNYFKDMLKSIPEYRKIVLMKFLIKDDKNLLKGCGFLKSDINRLNLEFKIFKWDKMKNT